MGAWGKEPWDNDTAADWFGALWESGNVPAAVRQGLDSESSDEAVAALWVCAELCRTYVWPIDAFDDTLRAAVAAAERILNGEDPDGYLELWNNDSEVVDRLRQFREALVARLPSAS